MKGDVHVVCPDDEIWPNLRVVYREGSPTKTLIINGVEYQESAGDGEILGTFEIRRNWGFSEVRGSQGGSHTK